MNTLIMGPTGCGKTTISELLKDDLLKNIKAVTRVTICSNPISEKQLHGVMQDLHDPNIEVIIEMAIMHHWENATIIEEKLGLGVYILLDRIIEISLLHKRTIEEDIEKYILEILQQGPNSLAFVYYVATEKANKTCSVTKFDEIVLKLCDSGILISSSGSELDPATVLSLAEKEGKL